MKKLYEFLLLYSFGAAAYGAIEIGYRGTTHWTMLILGGACFTIIYNIARKSRRPSWQKWIMGGFAITLLEFLTGLIVNVGLGWNVWNYSDLPMNVMGQICPLFSIAWCFLCIPVMGVCKNVSRR